MSDIIHIEAKQEAEDMVRQFVELSPQQQRDTLMFMAGLAAAQTAAKDVKSA